MTLRSLLAAAVIAVVATAPATPLRAQSAAEHVTMGDRERFSNPASALRHYEAALAADGRNFDALTKASTAAVEAGEGQSGAAQKEQYRKSEQYARRAIEVKPNDAEGHFALARALGRTAQTVGSRERVKYAGEVRSHALQAIEREPRHAGALHILGVWNAEIMRLNGVSRFMAKNFLGGKVFDSANWNDAQRYLEQAVQIEPNRLTHRIDLAEVYADRNNASKAREQIEFILRAPPNEANDAKYKREAEALRKRL
jgi:tetratricopeptide (TPR) repeat protein